MEDRVSGVEDKIDVIEKNQIQKNKKNGEL
jgi:hypothetical protein